MRPFCWTNGVVQVHGTRLLSRLQADGLRLEEFFETLG